jgi:RNA polymerase sigma factor (sigma-70 family)
LFVIQVEGGTGEKKWSFMSDTSGTTEVTRFFIEKYRTLVRYFQASYSDLSEMEAEDIVSDLMADLLERSEIMARVENTSAYIFRSIRNRVNDYLRRRKRTVPFETSGEGDDPTPGSIPEPSYDMTAEFAASEIRGRLVSALDDLAPDQRAVWIATELDGRSFQELADDWETPLGTLLARKHRANAALQKALQDLKER